MKVLVIQKNMFMATNVDCFPDSTRHGIDFAHIKARRILTCVLHIYKAQLFLTYSLLTLSEDDSLLRYCVV